MTIGPIFAAVPDAGASSVLFAGRQDGIIRGEDPVHHFNDQRFDAGVFGQVDSFVVEPKLGIGFLSYWILRCWQLSRTRGG